MRKILCVVLACVAILFVDVCCLEARAPRESDYVYLGVSGGYSVLSGKVSPMDVDGSLNLGGHLGYEYRHGLFLFRASANVQLLKSRCSTPISIPDMKIEDQVGTDPTMHYEMKSPLKERLTCLLLGVGFMAGYSQNSNNSTNLSEGGGFYVLGGLNLLCRDKFYSDVSLDYSTTATYSKYIDDYEDMPNHYYSEQHSEASVNFKKDVFFENISIMLSAEIGWEWKLNKYCHMLKLGAFCDTGLTNVMNNKETTECCPNHDNMSQIMVDSYYKSQTMKDKYVVPFIVGVRLGFSLNINNPSKCRSNRCNCYR